MLLALEVMELMLKYKLLVSLAPTESMMVVLLYAETALLAITALQYPPNQLFVQQEHLHSLERLLAQRVLLDTSVQP